MYAQKIAGRTEDIARSEALWRDVLYPSLALTVWIALSPYGHRSFSKTKATIKSKQNKKP